MANMKLPSEKAAARRMGTEERRFRAEDDLRSLKQAEQVRGDRSRLNAAQQIAREQLKALEKVTGSTSRKRGGGG